MKSINRRKIKKSKKNQGFTLVEMMIVLIILVGLAAIFGPRLLNSYQAAQKQINHPLVAKLNNAANEWVVLSIQAGNPDARVSDLGSDAEAALQKLQDGVQIEDLLVHVGLSESLTFKKLREMHITCADGVFSKA